MRIYLFPILLFLLTPMFSGCISDEQSKITITVEGTFEDGRDSGDIWDSFESNDREELSFSSVYLETCLRDDDDPAQPEETSCEPKDSVVIQSTCFGEAGFYGEYTTVVAIGATIGDDGLECDHDVVGLYEEGYLNATWRFVFEITPV